MQKRNIIVLALLMTGLFIRPATAQDHSHHQQHTHSEMAESADHVSADFKEAFTELVETVIDLKDALVESDQTQAVHQSDEAKDQLESIGEHRLEGENHMAWMEIYSNLLEHLESMGDANDLDETRAGFREMSGVLVDAVNRFGVDGVVYHQYCPMEDGAWLSSEERIMNPYAPETMPRCGSVIDRIAS